MIRKAFLLVAAFLIAETASEAALFLDRAAATVNNEVITWGEVFRLMQKELGPKTEGLAADERKHYLLRLAPRFLEKTVELRLELQEAKKLGIGASDDEVARAIERIRAENHLGEAEFEEALRQEGLELKEYKELLKDDIMLGKLIEREVKSRVNVTDADIRDHLAGKSGGSAVLRLSQIYIPGQSASSEAEARRIYAMLLKGEILFPDAARKYSEGMTADSGGELGEARQDQLIPEFGEALKAIGTEGITEPFMAAGGYNILRAEKVAGAGFQPDEISKTRLELQERAFLRELLDWRRRIRENAHIVVMF